MKLLVFPDRYEPGAEIALPRSPGGALGYTRIYQRPTVDARDHPSIREKKTRDLRRLDRTPVGDQLPVRGGVRLWCPEYPQLDFTTALTSTWRTDAHAVGYTIPGLRRAFRLRKGCLDDLVRLGHTPMLTAWFVDVDNPDHQPWPDDPAELQAAFKRLKSYLWILGPLAKGSGLYFSRGGFRLVRPIDPPLPITPDTELELEARVRGSLHVLSAEGLAPVVRGSARHRTIDASCLDWTRQMRLPFVVRDGVRQRLPADVSRMEPLDLRRIEPVWKLDEREGRALPSVVLPASGGSMEQALEFLADCPAAIEGQGGDSLTFRIACRLLEMRLSPQQAVAALSIWNQRCDPPWSEFELWQKVENAQRYGRFSAQRRLF